jgi:hypothetical protein
LSKLIVDWFAVSNGLLYQMGCCIKWVCFIKWVAVLNWLLYQIGAVSNWLLYQICLLYQMGCCIKLVDVSNGLLD